MKRVVIESPYAGKDRDDVDGIRRHLRYLRAAMHDCVVNHNESPYASHGLLPQPSVLCDEDEAERTLGIHAGFAWREVAEATVVYTDLGTSRGMEYGIKDAEKKGRPIEYRSLGPNWEENYLIALIKRPGLGWLGA